MKAFKHIKKAIIGLIICSISFSIIAITYAVPATATSDSEIKIYNFLVNQMQFTPAAACGVLANIEYESNFNPNLVGDSGKSYGICQWNGERFTNLKTFCTANNIDYTTVESQLQFLNYELNNYKSDTGYILDKLLAIENTADGAYQAGYDWCYYFERPANKAEKSETRGNIAKTEYWPTYSKPVISTLGDLNSDFKINSTDALITLQFSVGQLTLTSEQITAGDINKDGNLNSTDALIMLNISIGNDSISNYR